jgi:hypothetical protein
MHWQYDTGTTEMESTHMHWLLALCVGVGLAATCGFRVFVPLLGLSIAQHVGYLGVSPGFEWMGTWPAVIAFGLATVVEIGAYYIPWLDNLLDTIATPIAVVAGILVTTSVLGELPPFLRYTLGVILGGGAAGLVQGTSVVARGASTATTGGLANPLVATLELGASIVGTILSIVLPVIAIILVAVVLIIIFRRMAYAR